ncbi:hypothetical protein ACFYW9_40305 [Streptomyces sp. NPDC002698]|uniref:hypothetical protein n=1 Tax=Streptomyces sp. NPDC002698 TaxID=3364660 RepID=UPI00369DD024
MTPRGERSLPATIAPARPPLDVLKTGRLLFTNPIAQIPTGTAVSPIPLPLHHIRQALTAPDEAQAVVLAYETGLVSPGESADTTNPCR